MSHTPPRLIEFLASLCALLCVFSTPVIGAQSDYPARPIRLIVPFPPGGGADALSRALAPKLAERTGQSWVIDNRGGSGGVIATEIVARAQPDGYTVLLGTNLAALTASAPLYPKLGFNAIRDLQPITKLASAQYILAVHPSVPASNLTEFVAFVKSSPGTLNYSSAGVGSPLHLAAELFKYRASVDIVHVAYKGGGPAVLALLAGEVQVLFGSFASTLPHVKTGKLKAFAVTGAKRSATAPDLPTMAESGFPGFDLRVWYALLVPAKTPRPVVDRIYDEALRSVKLADVREAFARQGQDVETSVSPEALAQEIKVESAIWAKVIAAAGIKGE